MDDSLVDQFQLTLNIIVSLFVDRTIQMILKLNGFYGLNIFESVVFHQICVESCVIR